MSLIRVEKSLKIREIEKNWNTLARVENGSFNIPFERKTSFEEVTNKVNYNNLNGFQKVAIDRLSTMILKSYASSFDHIFPNDEENELCYLVSHKNRTFLVNNEGYNYCRYIVELINY